ncbi:membrane-spanning 4-domains subfamily A member 18-like [Ursus maritimus]|uniref:Membrane-spanning 4-domains subfamily A member 18-like n=1 Tax=Ursus maritimus TaxID=29073 RepID=A0A8M1GHF0_URSMA|nr:membrane-spanning 4-domains subfamily A member 18-like [Ursus maritimus]
MTEARATAGPPPPPQTPGEKGEGSGSTPHTPQWALNPGHGSPWQGGLLPPSSLLSPPGLFRLLLSLLPVSLLQVRTSLGTNILSAMAAFAGTAILLMDFGVTNWDVGRGYLAVLTIFTILEFFIAVIATHFGCQATRAQASTVSTARPLPTSAPTRTPEKGCWLEGSSSSLLLLP